MNIVSVFDGMSCGQIAINKLGIQDYTYYASEIDKHAIGVTQHNYPSTIQIGDITKASFKNGWLKTENGSFFVGEVDLFMGGSPCQSISNLGDGSGLDGKSGLFFHWLRLRDEIKPKHWLLENVVGSKKAISQINDVLGCSPYLINSNLFSAQNRARYYWTNIDVRNIPTGMCKTNLVDILDKNLSESSTLTPGRLKWLQSEKGQKCVKSRYAAIDPIKANCLTARSDASWNCNYVTRDGALTKLSPEEYEKLQTVPVGYTSCAKTSERYKMLGNGWTVDVIMFILKQMRGV